MWELPLASLIPWTEVTAVVGACMLMVLAVSSWLVRREFRRAEAVITEVERSSDAWHGAVADSKKANQALLLYGPRIERLEGHNFQQVASQVSAALLRLDHAERAVKTLEEELRDIARSVQTILVTSAETKMMVNDLWGRRGPLPGPPTGE